MVGGAVDDSAFVVVADKVVVGVVVVLVVVVVVLVVSSSCCCISCSGCGSGWGTLALVPPYVTVAALMKVAECLMARFRASTAPHGGNTGTSLGLKVRSAVVVHLAQEKKKSCLKKKSCWN